MGKNLPKKSENWEGTPLRALTSVWVSTSFEESQQTHFLHLFPSIKPKIDVNMCNKFEKKKKV